MNISLDEVKIVFINIIRGNITREEADLWAYELIKKMERNELFFCPPSEQEKIWSGIMYLYGIDLRDAPAEYFHSIDDIKEVLMKKLGGKITEN